MASRRPQRTGSNNSALDLLRVLLARWVLLVLVDRTVFPVQKVVYPWKEC